MENETIRNLDEFNNEVRINLLAPLVYLIILATIGIPGNFFVIVIFRSYKTNVYRTIILNIAIIDLLFCLIGIPFNICRILFYYTFKITWICQILAGVLDFGIMYSTHLLMLIAFHRYRQLFMMFKPQISTSNVKYFIFCCFVIGIAVATFQIAVLQPLEEIQLRNNITGTICAVTWKHSPFYWKVYNFCLTGLFLTYAVILFVIYGRIGRKIIVRRIFGTKQNSGMNVTSMPCGLSNKMTKISFAVSIVFIVSYLPLYINELLSKVIYEPELSPIEFSVMKIVERSYILNHVANPFIYAFFDVRFRQKLFKVLKSCCLICKDRQENQRGDDVENNIYSVQTSEITSTPL